MATIETAKAKWAAKMSNAGSKWKAGVSGKGAALKRGIASFLGVSPDAVRGEKITAYESGTGRITAEQFQASVAGKQDKWAENTRKGWTQA